MWLSRVDMPRKLFSEDGEKTQDIVKLKDYFKGYIKGIWLLPPLSNSNNILKGVKPWKFWILY